jgi:hypothetical protein
MDAFGLLQQDHRHASSLMRSFTCTRCFSNLRLRGTMRLKHWRTIWVQKFNEFYETVERHMHMEEEELFGQSGDVLTAQEADELETKVEAARKEISGSSTSSSATV